MAKILCKCGQLLSNSLAPNQVIIHTFTDEKMNEILREDSVSTIELYNQSNKVWHCSNCDRLYFFNENNEVDRVYSVE